MAKIFCKAIRLKHQNYLSCILNEYVTRCQLLFIPYKHRNTYRWGKMLYTSNIKNIS